MYEYCHVCKKTQHFHFNGIWFCEECYHALGYKPEPETIEPGQFVDFAPIKPETEIVRTFFLPRSGIKLTEKEVGTYLSLSISNPGSGLLDIRLKESVKEYRGIRDGDVGSWVCCVKDKPEAEW